MEMHLLPSHGWIGCDRCYKKPEQSRLIGAGSPPQWRIERPNGAWGSTDPLAVVLGFSRGARQSKPRPFDDIAFASMRGQLTKIMQALGLLTVSDHVDKRIRSLEEDFHFASLFRCSVSMWDKKKSDYAKSGNSILEKFLASAETRLVAETCSEQFLTALPDRTRLVMLLGNSPDYIDGCRSLVERLYPRVRTINEVAYTSGSVTWVHTIHAAAQGNYVPQWLAGADTAIGRKLKPAREAVQGSGVLNLLHPVR
jgi:hypothetical protein